MTTDLVLAPHVTLRAMQTDKFKTACFSVNYLRPHNRENAALEALLPSVLLRGSEQYPDLRSISTRLDELYGATLGTLVRRKGEAKLVGLYADFIEEAFLPEGEESFAPMIAFLEEVLFHPLTKNGVFCAAYVEGEKQNLVNAIEANLNDKRSYATERLLRQMCADEAYGVPRLGFAEDVAAITPESLWAHYQTMLRGSQVEIFYAGRRSAEDVAELLAPVFARHAPQSAAPVSTQIVRCAEKTQEITESLSVTQGKLVLGLRTGVTVNDPDYPALLLLNGVYGAGLTSKLFVKVREKLSLCYYASSSLDKYKGVMLVSSGIAFENYETAKRAILGELDACRRGEITDQELESARRQMLSAFRSAMDSPAQLDDLCLGRAVCGGDDLPALAEKLQALTADDLAAAARGITLDTVYFLRGVEA